jgi:RNA polymerase sigma-70 factor (ECF subfamily)
MPETLSTRASLLVRIRDPRDERAWAEFVTIYTPLVERVARARGLQDADAADLLQDVFRAVARAIERYDLDPARGSFRGWLFRIARNLAINLIAARARHPQGSGDTAMMASLEEQPDPATTGEESRMFDAEYRRRLFGWAADAVRDQFHPRTWTAFWRTAVEGHEPRDVATALGMSVGAVYIARSRVMSRLKDAIGGLDDPSDSPTAGA